MSETQIPIRDRYTIHKMSQLQKLHLYRVRFVEIQYVKYNLVHYIWLNFILNNFVYVFYKQLSPLLESMLFLFRTISTCLSFFNVGNTLLLSRHQGQRIITHLVGSSHGTSRSQIYGKSFVTQLEGKSMISFYGSTFKNQRIVSFESR